MKTVFLSIFLLATISVATPNTQIEGTLLDGISRQPISGAQVHLKQNSLWGISQRNGFFAIQYQNLPTLKRVGSQLEIEYSNPEIQPYQVDAINIRGEYKELASGIWQSDQDFKTISIPYQGIWYLRLKIGSKSYSLTWNSYLNQSQYKQAWLPLNLVDTLEILHQDYQTLDIPIYSLKRKLDTIQLLPRVSFSSSFSSSISISSQTSSSSQIIWSSSLLFPSSSSALSSVRSSSSISLPKGYGYFIDPRDFQGYRTVKIGNQEWMAENLKFHYQLAQTPPSILPNLKNNSWCYNDSIKNCDVYGRLYTWTAAMNLNDSCKTKSCINQINTIHQGICPADWHIPDTTEWNQLWQNLGGYSKAGSNAKSIETPHVSWNTSYNLKNPYLFSLQPTGSLSALIPTFSANGSFIKNEYTQLGEYSFMWSKESGLNTNSAYVYYTAHTSEWIIQNTLKKELAVPIRCLRNSSSSTAFIISSSSNSLNSSSSQELSYATLYDTRDNQVYTTIKIGSQTWMAENLNYQASLVGQNSWCYDNSNYFCSAFGRLYDWATAMNLDDSYNISFYSSASTIFYKQGICPLGWRMPNANDWSQLAITSLKSYFQPNSDLQNWSQKNKLSLYSGYNLLPGGIYSKQLYKGNTSYERFTQIWFSGEFSEFDAWSLYADSTSNIKADTFDKMIGASVRCVKQ